MKDIYKYMLFMSDSMLFFMILMDRWTVIRLDVHERETQETQTKRTT